MDLVKYMRMDSPVGLLTLVTGADGLESVQFGNAAPDGSVEDVDHELPGFFQLNEYFSGQRQTFDLPLSPRGTPFQHSVWRQLSQIPWGETRSYGDIARAIGRPGAARAVGMANQTNPIPIIIPCHRVIGANGSLTGYAGGLHVKALLLALEGTQFTGEQAAASHSRGRFTEPVAAPSVGVRRVS